MVNSLIFWLGFVSLNSRDPWIKERGHSYAQLDETLKDLRHRYPPVMTNSLLLNMAIEIVDLPIKNGDFT